MVSGKASSVVLMGGREQAPASGDAEGSPGQLRYLPTRCPTLTSSMVLSGVSNSSASLLVLNDVWETVDGKNWVQRSFTKIWPPRTNFGAVCSHHDRKVACAHHD